MTLSGRTLSFAEVLEEEYRYFFERVDHEKIAFDRRHIREMGHLTERLKLIKDEPITMRWHLVARRLPQSVDVSVGSEEGVLHALRQMLDDEKLLGELLKLEK